MNIETLKLSKVERLINNMCCHNPGATDEEVTRVYFLNNRGKIVVARTDAERARIQSKIIDKDIHDSKKFITNAIKILVLGIAEAGKTTIVQSLRFKHALVSNEERLRSFLGVQLIVCRSMARILKARTDFNIKFDRNESELTIAEANFKKNYDCNTNYNGAALHDFWDLVEILWKDDNLKALVESKSFIKVQF